MRRVIILFLAISVCGCAMAQRGAVSSAYKALAEGDCGTVYQKLSRAEKYEDVPELLQSEISFIRARCIEKEYRYNEAFALYNSIILRFPNTEYAVRSKGRVKSLASKVDL